MKTRKLFLTTLTVICGLSFGAGELTVQAASQTVTEQATMLETTTTDTTVAVPPCWQILDGRRYYIDANGNLATGLQAIDNNIYLFLDDGTMYCGWVTLAGRTFYFDANGVMQRAECVIDNQPYRFADTGDFVTGWCMESGRTLYRNEYGYPVTGLQTIDGDKYYFDEQGSLLTNTTIGLYVADENGKLTRAAITVDNLDAALDEILQQTGTDITSIAKYVKNTHRYKHIEKLSTREEMAVYAINNKMVSCYYYEALTGLLLERAGYQVVTVNGKGFVYDEHYWSLVYTTRNGVEGWYHVDALKGKYIRTDAEMVADGFVWNHADFPATP